MFFIILFNEIKTLHLVLILLYYSLVKNSDSLKTEQYKTIENIEEISEANNLEINKNIETKQQKNEKFKNIDHEIMKFHYFNLNELDNLKIIYNIQNPQNVEHFKKYCEICYKYLDEFLGKTLYFVKTCFNEKVLEKEDLRRLHEISESANLLNSHKSTLFEIFGFVRNIIGKQKHQNLLNKQQFSSELTKLTEINKIYSEKIFQIKNIAIKALSILYASNFFEYKIGYYDFINSNGIITLKNSNNHDLNVLNVTSPIFKMLYENMSEGIKYLEKLCDEIYYIMDFEHNKFKEYFDFIQEEDNRLNSFYDFVHNAEINLISFGQNAIKFYFYLSRQNKTKNSKLYTFMTYHIGCIEFIFNNHLKNATYYIFKCKDDKIRSKFINHRNRLTNFLNCFQNFKESRDLINLIQSFA
ncbi:hypothetical protein EHP00_1181 [Ecytonucleospora hepatopenaei]|uniref:Uncharacterized protein n=1 Tax=Ecytonucleospora hepatopenaei TaxID=646526 RepID=A0A1W0E8L8_9MICR|nr:hypothetical protein EHP00_2573 [Ecytonucleospora hepatopenaei]OQS55509.1 hypothetical protein EHP00_1181 [Ecytonucleospora hepatopenaei]